MWTRHWTTSTARSRSLVPARCTRTDSSRSRSRATTQRLAHRVVSGTPTDLLHARHDIPRLDRFCGTPNPPPLSWHTQRRRARPRPRLRQRRLPCPRLCASCAGACCRPPRRSTDTTRAPRSTPFATHTTTQKRAHAHSRAVQHTLRTRGFVSAHGDGRPPFVRAPSAADTDAEACGIDFGALVDDDDDDEYDPNEESEDDDDDNSERKAVATSLE